MSESLRMMVLALLFAGIMSLQFNMDADKTSVRQIKNALEFAVHDAALALDESELAYGEIVFDQEQAKENLEESLKSNLKLKDSATGRVYQPKNDSFYQEFIYIEHLEFLDHSNTSFPHNYYNSDYNIVDTLEGPSIVAVIWTRSPRYFVGNGMNIRKAVVYEYFQ